MPQRRWYNPHLPQTLAIAQILLYINGAFAFIFGVLGARTGASSIVRLLFLAAIAAYVYGGYGIANEKKRGWQVAVVAAFSPFILRFLDAFIAFDVFPLSWKIRYTVGLLDGGLLSVIFDVALIALLLHPMSRNHQKIWFE